MNSRKTSLILPALSSLCAILSFLPFLVWEYFRWRLVINQRRFGRIFDMNWNQILIWFLFLGYDWLYVWLVSDKNTVFSIWVKFVHALYLIWSRKPLNLWWACLSIKSSKITGSADEQHPFSLRSLFRLRTKWEPQIVPQSLRKVPFFIELTNQVTIDVDNYLNLS